MREIYLDNNSTTPIDKEVKETMLPYLESAYGNPSSLHKKGIEAERAIKDARGVFADILSVKETEIFFTSGATESINTAIKGVAFANKNKGKHIITSRGEHDAVLKACKWLEGEGFEVQYLDIAKDGSIKLEDIAKAVREDTILAAFMHVNNELGTIYPINEFAETVKEKNPGTYFFSDGVAAFGKLNINLDNIDLYAVSAHKVHGPKGTGLLVKKEGVKIDPLLHGGGQEHGLRSGTENVAAIAGFAKAAELACDNLSAKQKHLEALNDKFKECVKELENTHINSPQNGLPSVVNIAFLGVPSEVLLHALEEKGVYVSGGSACTGNRQHVSHVLEATGLDYDIVASSLRFSFSRFNTEAETEEVCRALKEIVPELREITQK